MFKSNKAILRTLQIPILLPLFVLSKRQKVRLKNKIKEKLLN